MLQIRENFKVHSTSLSLSPQTGSRFLSPWEESARKETIWKTATAGWSENLVFPKFSHHHRLEIVATAAAGLHHNFIYLCAHLEHRLGGRKIWNGRGIFPGKCAQVWAGGPFSDKELIWKLIQFEWGQVVTKMYKKKKETLRLGKFPWNTLHHSSTPADFEEELISELQRNVFDDGIIVRGREVWRRGSSTNGHWLTQTAVSSISNQVIPVGKKNEQYFRMFSKRLFHFCWGRFQFGFDYNSVSFDRKFILTWYNFFLLFSIVYN